MEHTFLLDLCLESNCLVIRYSLCSTLVDNAIWFSYAYMVFIVVASMSLPSAKYENFSPSDVCALFYCGFNFYSLMTNGHLSYILWPFEYPLLWSDCSGPCARFVISFYKLQELFLSIRNTSLYQLYLLQISSPIWWFPFHPPSGVFAGKEVLNIM